MFAFSLVDSSLQVVCGVVGASQQLRQSCGTSQVGRVYHTKKGYRLLCLGK